MPGSPRDVRIWHVRGAVGLGVATAIRFAAGGATGELNAAAACYDASAIATVALVWALVHNSASRTLLLVWPMLGFAGMYGASYVTPKAATLCLASLVLAFLFIGLTQRRGMGVAMWPAAVLPWWRLVDLPADEAAIRLALASVTWLAVAELPARLVTDLRRARSEMAQLAATDPLTGLANRRTWDHRIRQLTAQDADLALLMVDLDYFKAYNDEHGHLAGDMLLTDFADTVRSVLREQDLVARWGGEEFAVVLPGASCAEAERIGRRILQAVPRGQSCSIGLVARRPGEVTSELVARADAALYRAKQEGRGRLVGA